MNKGKIWEDLFEKVAFLDPIEGNSEVLFRSSARITFTRVMRVVIWIDNCLAFLMPFIRASIWVGFTGFKRLSAAINVTILGLLLITIIIALLE